jgi:hypothetical protein
MKFSPATKCCWLCLATPQSSSSIHPSLLRLCCFRFTPPSPQVFLHFLYFFSLLLVPHSRTFHSAGEQKRVFDRPPNGVIKVIASTNIAETSITIGM